MNIQENWDSKENEQGFAIDSNVASQIKVEAKAFLEVAVVNLPNYGEL